MIRRGRFQLFANNTTEYSTAAVDLVRESTVIDMLGLLTLDYRKLTTWEINPQSFDARDLLRLKNSGITIFHPAVGYTTGDIYSSSMSDIVNWNAFIDAHEADFLRVNNCDDILWAKAHGKIGIIIGQQNSSHFRVLDDVDRFYKLGQRVSQLTYAPNQIGGGSSDPNDPGLSLYGREVIERMNTLGMVVDVSHCADRTTLDAVEASRKPVLITHSNCRALVPNRARCKTDEAIRRMAAKGGVMGVTMIRSFVRASGPTTVSDVLDHIDHIVRLVGVEHVGIGTDVDLVGRNREGYPKTADLDGIHYEKKIFDLTEGLLRRNYPRRDIELILGGNFRRALSEIWVG